MAKIKGPLFSMTAHGKIGERLVFSKRSSGQQARFQRAQTDFETPARTAQRAVYRAAVLAWNALTLEQKAVYNVRAQNLHYTGYNLFVKENSGVVSLLVNDYVTLIESEGGSISSDQIARITASLILINTYIGIDHLVDACFLRSTQNIGSGSVVYTLRGILGTLSNSPIWRTSGMYFDGVNQRAEFSGLPDTKIGSLAISFKAGPTPVNNAMIGHLCNSAGLSTACNMSFAYLGASWLNMYTRQGGSVNITGTNIDGAPPYGLDNPNIDPHTVIGTTNNGAPPTVKAYVDGRLARSNSVNSIQVTSSITKLVLAQRFISSGSYDIPFQGTIKSWLLFDVELTADQADIVNVAFEMLQPNYRIWVFEGDSTTTFIYTKPTDNYPYQLRERANYNAEQFIPYNVALNGQTASSMNSSYASEIYPYRPAFSSRLSALLFIWGGINETYYSGAAATTYNSLKSLWAKAKADGFKVFAGTLMPSRGYYLHKSALTGTGTTATFVTTSAHGLNNGDTVTIYDADQAEYNGTFIVTVVNATTFTYTTLTTITASPATSSAGFDIVVKVPILANMPAENIRQQLNTLILSDTSLYDYVFRRDLLFPDCTDSTYFLNSLHLKTAGNTEIACEIEQLLQNNSDIAPDDFWPASLSPSYWFEAQYGTFKEDTFATRAYTDGDSVGGWKDRSGNGRHLKQSNSNARPFLVVDGFERYIQFDNSLDFLQTAPFTVNQPSTIYLVFKQVTWTLHDRILDGTTANSNMIRQYNTASPNLGVFNQSGGGIDSNSDLPLDTWGVVRIVFNGASSKLQVNNNTEQSGSLGALASGGLTLGAAFDGTFPSNIRVKCLMMFPSAIANGSADDVNIKNYLASRFGLSI